jgi:hypothetical protein
MTPQRANVLNSRLILPYDSYVVFAMNRDIPVFMTEGNMAKAASKAFNQEGNALRRIKGKENTHRETKAESKVEAKGRASAHEAGECRLGPCSNHGSDRHY